MIFALALFLALPVAPPAAPPPLPPLSPAQAERLATARDGGEFRELAFEALVEWTRAWDGEIGDAALRVEPNFAVMARSPTEYRGDLCRIVGTIQQQTALGPPYEDVAEWFVRNADGIPCVVYVVGSGDLGSGAIGSGSEIEVGDRARIDGRFYKRIDLAARDERVRGYPAFVGRAPRLLPPQRSAPADRGDGTNAPATANDSLQRLWLVGLPVGLMLVAFVMLRARTRRKASSDLRERARFSALHGRAMGRFEQPDEVDAGGPLPDDPAEALAELKRRAERAKS